MRAEIWFRPKQTAITRRMTMPSRGDSFASNDFPFSAPARRARSRVLPDRRRTLRRHAARRHGSRRYQSRIARRRRDAKLAAAYRRLLGELRFAEPREEVRRIQLEAASGRREREAAVPVVRRGPRELPPRCNGAARPRLRRAVEGKAFAHLLLRLR